MKTLFHYLIANLPEAVQEGATCPDLSLCTSPEDVRRKGHVYWRDYVDDVEAGYDPDDDHPDPPGLFHLEVFEDGSFQVHELTYQDGPRWDEEDQEDEE